MAKIYYRWIISIHAPTQGATEALDETDQAAYISIHAPTQGATIAVKKFSVVGAISIHAPTQGATAKDMRFQQIFCSSLTNHRALTATPYNLQGLS